jgi:hypothetical protein
MAIDKDLESLAREKADEIIYRQKVQELSSAVTDVIRVLPNSLQELRYALELLDRDNENERLKLKEVNDKIINELKDIKRDLDQLFVKIRDINIPGSDPAIQKIIDRNDSNSLINVIQDMSKRFESLVSDMNNDKSMAKILESRFTEQRNFLIDLNNEKSLLFQTNKNAREILKELNEKNNVKSYVTWVLISILTIVSILNGLGILGK